MSTRLEFKKWTSEELKHTCAFNPVWLVIWLYCCVVISQMVSYSHILTTTKRYHIHFMHLWHNFHLLHLTAFKSNLKNTSFLTFIDLSSLLFCFYLSMSVRRLWECCCLCTLRLSANDWVSALWIVFEHTIPEATMALRDAMKASCRWPLASKSSLRWMDHTAASTCKENTCTYKHQSGHLGGWI